jgi:hypothetical protein
MEIKKYRNIFPHVAAAIQFSNTNGRLPLKGDILQYVYTNSQHQNPLNRIATGFAVNYDKEKYKDMLLDAAETILGIFGFDRTVYGKAKDKKSWMQLRRNRISDVKAEIDSY